MIAQAKGSDLINYSKTELLMSIRNVIEKNLYLSAQ